MTQWTGSAPSEGGPKSIHGRASTARTPWRPSARGPPSPRSPARRRTPGCRNRRSEPRRRRTGPRTCWISPSWIVTVVAPAWDRDPGTCLPGMPPHRRRLHRDAGRGERRPRAGRSAAPPATAGAGGNAPARGPRAGRPGPPRGSCHRRVQDRARARGLPDPGGLRGGPADWGTRGGRQDRGRGDHPVPRAGRGNRGRGSPHPPAAGDGAGGRGTAVHLQREGVTCSRSRITTRRSFRRSSGAFRLQDSTARGRSGRSAGRTSCTASPRR